MSTPITTQREGGFRCLEFPARVPSKQYTAVVWLHGSGQRGTDLQAITKYGLPAALLGDRLSLQADAICPQLDFDQEWEPTRTKTLLDSIRAEYQCSVLIGFSLGALGICDLLAEHGSCANLNIAIAARTRKIVTVQQQGTRVLSISGERDIWPSLPEYLRRLRELGAEVEETIIPNEGHYISESALMHESSHRAFNSIGQNLDWKN